MARGRPLHRLIIHSSAVSLSKFRMLTRRCRVGSSSCSLNNFPLVPKLRPPSLLRFFVVIPDSLATLPQLSMISCARLCSCTHLRLSASLSHVSAQPLKFVFGVFQKCLTEVPRQTSCPVVPLQTASANHNLRRCFFQRFLFFF